MRKYAKPSALMDEHDAAASKVNSADYIRLTKYRPLKEVWSAARFGIGYERNVQHCDVCVNDVEQSDTDFFVRIGNLEHPFQTVIAMPPERRMGDDYLPTTDGSRKLRPYEPERGRQEGPTWIASAIAAKVEKAYSDAANLNLLVYANFSAHELTADMIRAAIPADHARRFGSIWVMTNHQICSVFSTAPLGSIPSFVNVVDLDEPKKE